MNTKTNNAMTSFISICKHSAFIIIFIHCLTVFNAAAVESFPPIVPEGETFEDVESLTKNIIPQYTVNAVAFSPDGKTLASGADDNTVRLWDVASGKEIRRLEGHRKRVVSVAFSPDGKTLASGAGNFLGSDKTVWDVASGKEIRSLAGHTKPVQSVAFSPDGKTLASGSGYLFGSSDNTVRLWDIASGKLTQIYVGGQNGNWLTWNTQKNICLRYDDGTFLVNKNKEVSISSIPPRIKHYTKQLQDISVPESLEISDGIAEPFHITIKNSKNAPVYWINTSQVMDNNNLVFHPPKTKVILKPGKTWKMKCHVSALSKHDHPQESNALLHLKITTAHGNPVFRKIPVKIKTPILEIGRPKLQKQEKQVLLVSVKNTGKQNLDTETEFSGNIAGIKLNSVKLPKINAGEAADLSFIVPNTIKINKNTLLSLFAVKLTAPVHRWKFTTDNIILPMPFWILLLILTNSFFVHRNILSPPVLPPPYQTIIKNPGIFHPHPP
ncbi:MAG: WD40 repeat domain-containing protein [Desulfobacteraceae bacterium]|nr:WD40 repeat domain-containing protein [Desulfobacteraceae bacterium]